MTNTDEVYVTEQGLADMKKELEYLKMEKRPAVIEALKEARALGDLSENAEYDAARNEQSETENRIAVLEKQIEKAIVIKNVKRPEVIEALKEARALGDLSENAEYDAARGEQASTEGRIKELEVLIENAKIIDEVSTDKVTIGNNVKIEYVEDGEIETYSIVGSTEADPFENKISNESPIAKAILGAKVDDVVAVESPNGKYNVKIVEIF